MDDVGNQNLCPTSGSDPEYLDTRLQAKSVEFFIHSHRKLFME